MRKLLNTLYVTSENSYLSLDGENIVVLEEQKELGRIPLHTEYFFMLPFSAGKIPGAGLWKNQRKCDIKRAAVCK